MCKTQKQYGVRAQNILHVLIPREQSWATNLFDTRFLSSWICTVIPVNTYSICMFCVYLWRNRNDSTDGWIYVFYCIEQIMKGTWNITSRCMYHSINLQESDGSCVQSYRCCSQVQVQQKWWFLWVIISLWKTFCIILWTDFLNKKKNLLFTQVKIPAFFFLMLFYPKSV